ncbi:MAG: hypothetical protein U0Q18_26750 [Bryobacteraceae bacterium]
MRHSASALLFAFLTLPLPGQDTVAQVKTEIERLQQSIKEHPLRSVELSEAVSAVNQDLKSAAAAADAGRIYVALEGLGRAMDLLEGLRKVTEKEQAMKGGLPAFESELDKTKTRLADLRRPSGSSAVLRIPAAIQALAETAQGQSVPLLEGGRGFAVATGPRDGLFYLGQAEGEAEFARFCTGLRSSESKRRAELRSVLPELNGLQVKTNIAFRPPLSIDLHPRFIALNSTLKLAQELDGAGFYAGALFKYLDAVRHYAMIDAKPLDSDAKERLKLDLAAARRKLDSSSQDESIAQLFLERAEMQLSAPAPSEDEWRSVRVTLDRVLPAYFSALQPPTSQPQVSGKTVDITLVRWPYT